MPKVKNDIQDTSINDPRKNILVEITFYFKILKQSILDFFDLPVNKYLEKETIFSDKNNITKLKNSMIFFFIFNNNHSIVAPNRLLITLSPLEKNASSVVLQNANVIHGKNNKRRPFYKTCPQIIKNS